MRGAIGTPRKVNARGDRCDPETLAVLGNEFADQRYSGSHSRAQKLLATLSTSIVRSSSAHVRLSSRISRADSVDSSGACPASTSPPAQPLTQRLRAGPQPSRDGLDGRPLRLLVPHVILDQANRLRPGLLIEPTRHRAILPNLGGVHETRDGSLSTVRAAHRRCSRMTPRPVTLDGLKGANCGRWSQEDGLGSRRVLNRVSQV